jgi:hypothetical protein
MSPDGKLFYYDSKDDFEQGKPALNEIAFDLTQCVIKFDLSKAKTSKHHPINIAPKNWQGGEKEVFMCHVVVSITFAHGLFVFAPQYLW